MGGNRGYFEIAESEYKYLEKDYTENRVSNIFAYLAQGVCEKYLKGIIVYTNNEDICNGEMRTHSLRKLCQFIMKHIPDFIFDYRTILLADGFYFSARYPGDDSVIVEKEEFEQCWEAVTEVRNSVNAFMKNQKQCNNKTNALEEISKMVGDCKRV